MLRQGRYPAGLVIAGALLAAVACNDRRTPTSSLAPSDEFSAAQGGNARVKVAKLQLSANTLRIEGPAVTASVSFSNSGPAIQTNISYRAEIVQGATTRQAAKGPTQCNPGDAPGFLPSGGCDMSIPITASNAAVGSGTLVPGAAVLVMRVVETTGSVQTELGNKSVAVNLVQSPVISALTLTSTTLAINGPSVGWTATLQNPAKSLQGVALQGTILQTVEGFPTRRAAGGVLVACGSSVGVMPPGTCTITFSAVASSAGTDGQTLVPGAAVFELQMIQTVNGVATTLDTRTVAVTLVSSTPTIASLALASTSILIGSETNYTVQIQNPGFPLADVGIQGEMVQGTVLKGAGGTGLACGGAFGALPTGTCTIQFTAAALGDAEGGAFQPGLAQFVLRLYKANGIDVAPTELDVKTVEVTLVSPIPTITSIDPAWSYAPLDGGFTPYTATIANPGASRSGVLTQNWISQGSTRRAAGGIQVRCDGGTYGVLPAGTCTTPGDIVAANGQALGTGTLVLGPATLEVELKHWDGTTETILDTRSIPITLVPTTPSIVSLAFNTTTTIAIGGQARYTTTLFNPTSVALTGALIQGSITQGAVESPAGGVVTSCPTNGAVQPGTCVVSFTANPSGADGLVAGPATFVLKFYVNGVVVDTKLVPITLVSP